MIKKLTKKQKELLPIYAEKWIKIGLSTEPINYEMAKKYISEAYKVIGLKVPEHWYVFDSPMSAIKGIKEMVGDLKTQSQILNEMVYGNHDAHWLGFYQYFKDELDLRCVDKLSPLIELAKYCGWWSPYKNVVVLQHRPSKLIFDDNKRLHCENGYAIEYRDGFGLCSWHGILIPNEWIFNSPPSPEKILKWEDIEQRRCACEILGWDNILLHLDAQIVDANPDPEIGLLLECDLPDSGKEKFLKVLCGTGREFIIPVPLKIKTALQAQAWTWGYDNVENFVPPEVRT